MSNFLDDTAPTNLEQVLGNQAETQVNRLRDSQVQKRKRLVSQQAASGRLNSGVSNYPLADFDTAGANAESEIYSTLAAQLGGISSEDLLNQNDYNRNLQLSELIGTQNRPSKLQEAIGVLGAGTHIFCGGYVENLSAVVDLTTGERGVMAEKEPELIIRISTLGLKKEDLESLGLMGPMTGFDEAKISDDQIRNLIRKGLENFNG